MATKDSLKQDGEQFGAAFDEETAAPVEQTEDEAFGLNLPATEGAAEGDGETDGAPVATQAGEETIVAEGGEALPEEPPAEEVAAAEAEAVAGEDDMPPMTQAEKSWEGRLRKREEELKALAAELEARKGEGETTETNGEEVAEAGGEVLADESGEIDADEAMRQLTEDFGADFVKMIVAIATKQASEAAGAKVQEIGNTLKDVIDDIKNSRTRRHFKEIYRAHPDFVEVSDSDAFKAWIEALPPAEKSEADRVIQGGDSDEINDLLAAFKNVGAASAEGGSDEELEAAEGVRSPGLRLPAEPGAGKDDFAAAWDEFS